MGYPSDFPNKPQIKVGIIAGGDVTDPAQDQSCNQRVYLPMEHSPDGVEIQHLAMSSMQHSPTNHSQQSFPGTMDPGTLVYVMKTTGQNEVSIIGQANDLYNSKSTPGNFDLMMGNQIVQELINRTIQVNIPPNIQESEEDGAKIRKIKEKNQEHSHSLLKGLPTHGALFNMAGFALPQLQQIPTAVQKFQNIMTGDMMNMLPGDIMSMGQMFQGLMNGGRGSNGGFGGVGAGTSQFGGTGQVYDDYYSANANVAIEYANNDTYILTANQVPGYGGFGNGDFSVAFAEETRFDSILSSVKPEVRDAIINYSTLIQGMESQGNAGSYVTSSRVHAPTFLDNAQDLLSQVTNIDELMFVLDRLQSDESLFGWENLEPVQFYANTTWGTGVKTLYANGYVTHDYVDSNTSNQIASFENAMSSPSSSPTGSGGGGGGGGGNMFGQSAQKMMEMLKRLPPGQEDKGRRLVQKVSQENQSQDLMAIIKKATGGGNPLDFLQNL